MIADDLHDEDDLGAERAALFETRQAARDRWFRRFAANERRHRTADAWARRAEASQTHSHRNVTSPPRFP